MAVPGAEWQAGVTPDNDLFRVTLDGMPVPLAFAASDSRGWVMVFAEPRRVAVDDANGPKIKAYRIPRQFRDDNPTGSAADFAIRRGAVRIVRE